MLISQPDVPKIEIELFQYIMLEILFNLQWVKMLEPLKFDSTLKIEYRLSRCKCGGGGGGGGVAGWR